MKKTLLLLCVCLISFAAVKPGENLLINSVFRGALTDPVTGLPLHSPELWTAAGKIEGVTFVPGTDEKPGIVRFSQFDKDNTAPEVHVSQAGLRLVPGETYRISALVRTVNFESNHYGIVVYNRNWAKDCGLWRSFKKNMDWTRVTKDVKMVTSPDGVFTMGLFACDFKGTMEISDVKLEAVSEKALQESKRSEIAEIIAAPMLLPWKPLLHKITIPQDGTKASEIEFRFFGTLPEGTEHGDYDIRYAVNDAQETTIPLQNGFNKLALGKNMKPGEFTLNVSVVNRSSGNVICKNKYPAAFVPEVKIDTRKHRRLNNLVVEVLNENIEKKAGEQYFDFCTTRDGWVFITAKNTSADGLEVVLDGKLTVINATTPLLETFREIPVGPHTLTVKGAASGGTLVVRTIPEIFNYSMRPSLLPENPKYDWDFQCKYVLPSMTTVNSGDVPWDKVKEFLGSGRKWIGSMGTTYASADAIVARLNRTDGMNKDHMQGVTCDEQFYGAFSSILPYTEGVKRFVPKNDHVIYTWVCGSPTVPGVHTDFLATCFNASYGKGRVLSEVYCPTMPTLEKAKEYLDGVLTDKARRYASYYPNALDHWGIIFGDFIQLPTISLAHHPHVDYKYYLDMQWNYLANKPECKDMAITGYWGTRHCDFEAIRWAFMLTRHYCVEGKKNMLSDDYGFSYAPGHLANNDFEDGLKNWNTTGNVTAESSPEFAHNSQCRYMAPKGLGDTLAVLTKKADETSTVSQVAKGLKPGRLYCLQFSVVDFNDLKNKTFNPHQYPIGITLGEGAEIDMAQSWIHVDKRTKGQYEHNNNTPRINLHHIVFKATKPEITITFDNAKAAQGEALAVNYVMLNPFLPLQ